MSRNRRRKRLLQPPIPANLIETLEPRLLLSADTPVAPLDLVDDGKSDIVVEASSSTRQVVLNPSGSEQEMLEMINRMRTNPSGELNVLFSSLNPLTARDPDVQSAVSFFGVSSSTLQSQWSQLSAVPPLAWNESLSNAALAHNQAMIAFDQQSHQLPGESSSLSTRYGSFGYDLTQTGGRVGENVFAFAESVVHGHAGMAVDWGNSNTGIQQPPGHRDNIMSSGFREIGLSIVPESNGGTDVGPLVLTQSFGERFGTSPFLLGVVYDDTNNNNFYNNGEGLGGVTVQAIGVSGTFSTTSMLAGGYQLQLPAGTYSVVFTGDALGGSVTMPNVVVSTNNVKVDATTDDVLGSSIQGTVFNDVDNNGIQAPGDNDPGLEAWTVYLDQNANNTLDVGEVSVQTDSVGNYIFANLNPGGYNVTVGRPNGWTATSPVGGTHIATLSQGQSALDLDFGNRQIGEPGSIAGKVFDDFNANGLHDSGEPGLASQTVFLDANGNGEFDPGESSQVTDSNGTYSFTNLESDTYTVLQDPVVGRVHSVPEFSAALTGDAHVPAVVTDGAGYAYFSLSERANELFFDISFANLSSATTSLGLYSGQAGVAGSLIHDLAALANVGPGFGSPISGSVVLSGNDLADLVDGKLYVSIGTQTHPTGEVRGQVLSQASHVIPLAAGQNVANRDFGSFNLVSLQGTVFEDINGNGSRESQDPALGGQTVYLDDNANGQLDANELRTNAAANGNYFFTNLVPGSYRVALDTPAGWGLSTPGSLFHEVTSVSGQTVQSLDFGSFEFGTIAGQVFDDINQNGLKEPGESGLENWSVFLDSNRNGEPDENETVVQSDINGNYQFNDLVPGTVYDVGVEDQLAWVRTTPEFIVTLSADQQVPPTTSIATGYGVFVADTITNTLNFEVHFDNLTSATTGLHIHRGGQGLIGNVIYDLSTAAGQGNGFTSPLIGSVAFSPNDLDDLQAGTMYVNVHTSNHANGEIRGQIHQSETHRIPIVSGSAVTSRDFGHKQGGTVQGRVFDDLDGDGFHDTGEEGTNGMVIELVDSSDQVIASMTTISVDLNGDQSIDPETEQGLFRFDAVLPGDFEVRQVLPSNLEQTSPPFGDGHLITVAADDLIELEFGNFRNFDLSSTSGTIYEDIDGNGVQDIGEPGLANQRVYLDLNFDGTFNDAVEPSMLSDADGLYTFTDLEAGNYMIRTVIPDDWTSISPANGVRMITLAQSETFTELDFGLARYATIRGQAINDLNGDGTLAITEPGLNGITIELVDPLVPTLVFDSVVTQDVDLNQDGQIDPLNEQGLFEFQNVVPGSYEIRAVLTAAFTSTFPVSGSHVEAVDSGQLLEGIEFGRQAVITPGTITGRVFEDLNADGVEVGGEPGFSGRTVFLDTDGDGQLDAGETHVTTDTFGAFEFLNVLPSAYNVTILEEADLTPSLPVQQLTQSVTVSEGQDVTDIDFGLFRFVTIAGQQFADINDNGVRDGDEPGLNGVNLRLIDAITGQLVATAVSHNIDLNSDSTIDPLIDKGRFEFTNLRPGSFLVTQDVPEGFRQTAPDGGVYTFELTSGQSNTTVHFGNVGAPDLPDLDVVLDPGTVPGTTVVGTKGRVRVNLTNIGSLDMSRVRFDIEVFLSDTVELDGENELRIGSLLRRSLNLRAGRTQGINIRTQVPTDAPIGNYLMVARATPSTGVVFNELTEANNTDNDQQVLVTRQFGNIPGEARPVRLSLINPNTQANVTFTLRGAGYGDVTPTANGFDIDLSGTTDRSAVTVSSRGRTQINDITVDGSIRDISARRIDLNGDITINGGLNGRLVFDDVLGDSTISIGGLSNVARPRAQMQFDDIQGLIIDSSTPLRSIRATNWENVSDSPVAITAPRLSDLNIRRDLIGVDMSLTNVATTNVHNSSLGKLSVRGIVDDVNIRTPGHVSAVQAGVLRNSTIFAGVKDGVTQFPPSPSDFVPGSLASIQRLQVRGIRGQQYSFENTKIAAPEFGRSLSIRGNIETVNAGVTFGFASLHQFSVRGYTNERNFIVQVV